jgi:hypothetical protein
MAFKLTQSPTFKANVTVDIASEKGGWEKSHFTAEFKRVTAEDLDRMREMPNPEVMREVLVGWANVNNDSNEAVPFTPEHRDAMLAIPAALSALTIAFWENQLKAKAKN